MLHVSGRFLKASCDRRRLPAPLQRTSTSEQQGKKLDVVLILLSRGSTEAVFLLSFRLKKTFILPLFPSISPTPASQSVYFFIIIFFRSRGRRVRESGWVKSRTHEIFKSFLGSPHQHMLLSSPLHFPQLCFSFARSLPLLLPLAASGVLNAALAHVPLPRPFMHSPIHSAPPGRLTLFYFLLREIRFVSLVAKPTSKSCLKVFAVFPSKLMPTCAERIQGIFNARRARTEAETLNEPIIPRSWNSTDSTPCFFLSLSNRASETSDLISSHVVLFAPFD